MNRILHFLVGSIALVCAALSLASPAVAQAPSPEVAALRARCGTLATQARTACYDQQLLALLEKAGVAPTMKVLEQLGEADQEVRREGHLYAHSIGLAAFRGADQVGATFGECTPIFQSGCYHGVIQSYFVDLMGAKGPEAVTADAVNALCASYRGNAATRWLLFQCVHGIGHGFATVHQHNLPRMLAGCDLLRESWERDGCYGGAFMENVVQATAPHHMVGRPEEAGDEHAGMDHGDMAGMDHEAMGHGTSATEAPYKMLDKDDPHYPCNTLDSRYLRSCYGMQTSAILWFNGGDVPATAKACDGAPEEVRTACYQSLGRDISSYTLQNHARAAQLCSNGDPAYQPWCHVGYTKNLIDLDANAADGIAYCRSLTDVAAKTACYRAVGEETWVLTDDREKRRAWCATAEEPYREECSLAAGLGTFGIGNREQGTGNSGLRIEGVGNNGEQPGTSRQD